jgi:hypothetical protein
MQITRSGFFLFQLPLFPRNLIPGQAEHSSDNTENTTIHSVKSTLTFSLSKTFQLEVVQWLGPLVADLQSFGSGPSRPSC